MVKKDLNLEEILKQLSAPSGVALGGDPLPNPGGSPVWYGDGCKKG
ncbi:MAG: hypothetical protein QG657_804 [Acidobacteriota bacterium]|nr:hypothetical protein [Acidobacteriota bacterium]